MCCCTIELIAEHTSLSPVASCNGVVFHPYIEILVERRDTRVMIIFVRGGSAIIFVIQHYL